MLYFFYRQINTNIIRSGSLEDVYALAQLANANLVSLGSSLEHVHVPGRGVPEDTIPHGEVEVGMGIHNEPGSHRVKFDLVELVQGMLLQLLDHNDPDRCYVTRKPEDEFVLLINNLGGVSPLELAGITDEVYRQLKRDYQVNMVRVIQGTFLTSLNGLGFSISLMKLVDPGLGVKTTMLELLDAPAEAVGWSAPINTSTWEKNLNADPVDLKNSNLAEDIHSNLQRKFPPPIASTPSVPSNIQKLTNNSRPDSPQESTGRRPPARNQRRTRSNPLRHNRRRWRLRHRPKTRRRSHPKSPQRKPTPNKRHRRHGSTNRNRRRERHGRDIGRDLCDFPKRTSPRPTGAEPVLANAHHDRGVGEGVEVFFRGSGEIHACQAR